MSAIFPPILRSFGQCRGLTVDAPSNFLVDSVLQVFPAFSLFGSFFPPPAVASLLNKLPLRPEASLPRFSVFENFFRLKRPTQNPPRSPPRPLHAGHDPTRNFARPRNDPLPLLPYDFVHPATSVAPPEFCRLLFFCPYCVVYPTPRCFIAPPNHLPTLFVEFSKPPLVSRLQEKLFCVPLSRHPQMGCLHLLTPSSS